MIKANRFGIDNFVIYKINGEDKICQIEGLNKEYVQLKVVNPLDFLEDEIPIERCQPIELTPEWLERCGFERTGATGDVYIKDGVAICINAAGFEFEWPADHWDDDQEPNIRLIEHLHQLQNLYSALTGEELNVKL